MASPLVARIRGGSQVLLVEEPVRQRVNVLTSNTKSPPGTRCRYADRTRAPQACRTPICSSGCRTARLPSEPLLQFHPGGIAAEEARVAMLSLCTCELGVRPLDHRCGDVPHPPPEALPVPGGKIRCPCRRRCPARWPAGAFWNARDSECTPARGRKKSRASGRHIWWRPRGTGWPRRQAIALARASGRVSNRRWAQEGYTRQ